MADVPTDTAPEVHKDCTEKDSKGNTVSHLECANVICGTLMAASLFCEQFKENIERAGFAINPHDRCVANKMVNGEQCTMPWHVDDFKASHMEDEVPDELADCLRESCDDEEIGTMEVNGGPRCEFAGMV